LKIFHKKDEKLAVFSKGQKQRLALARALINNPNLLILDEPTIGLDVEGMIIFREYLQKIKLEGTTILVSSHHLDELQKICDRYGFIKKGKILEEASFLELKNKYSNQQDDPDIEKIYKKIFNIL
jgi:ABC-type multidrug transport system ATPase subunit